MVSHFYCDKEIYMSEWNACNFLNKDIITNPSISPCRDATAWSSDGLSWRIIDVSVENISWIFDTSINFKVVSSLYNQYVFQLVNIVRVQSYGTDYLRTIRKHGNILNSDSVNRKFPHPMCQHFSLRSVKALFHNLRIQQE